jgi:hypothetical protein
MAGMCKHTTPDVAPLTVGVVAVFWFSSSGFSPKTLEWWVGHF